MTEREQAVADLRDAIERSAARLAATDFYMPSLATLLRVYADDLADKYPDDINGGQP